jgi:hypothetical protein
MKQNKPFISISWLFEVFYYSNRKLSNTWTHEVLKSERQGSGGKGDLNDKKLILRGRVCQCAPDWVLFVHTQSKTTQNYLRPAAMDLMTKLRYKSLNSAEENYNSGPSRL